MSKSPDELREELFELAPVNYERWFDKNSLYVWTAIDILESAAIGAARLAAYLEARAHDQGHDTAVRSANATVAKVRRALGYTIHKQDLHF